MFFRFRKKKPFELAYTNALNAIVDGNNKKALKILRNIVTQNTNHVNAYLQMGNILRQEGNIKGAIKIHQSLTVRPNLDKTTKKEIHKSLALDFIESSQFVKAENEVKYVLKFEKKNLWANELLLKIYDKQEQWDEALKICKIIQRIKNEKKPHKIARYFSLQGKKELEKGKFDEALSLFQKSLKVFPDYQQPNLYLGDYCAQEGKLSDAINYWEKYALSDNVNNSKVFNKIEDSLFEINRFEEVEDFYRKVLKHNPFDLHAIMKLSNILEQKGKINNAIKLINEFLLNNQNSIIAKLIKLKLKLFVNGNFDASKDLESIINYELNK